MNVSPGHVLYPLYRLWIYILSKSLIPMWFVKYNGSGSWYDDDPKTKPESFVPLSLCPFLNRLVIYFLIQVPLMFIGFGCVALIFAGSQILLLMAWFITGDFGDAIRLLEEPIGVFGAMFLVAELVVATVFALLTLKLHMRKNREKKWVQCVYAATDAPRMFFKPVLYPWHIFSMWYEARHDKFCPTLTFNVKQEKSTSEKQE